MTKIENCKIAVHIDGRELFSVDCATIDEFTISSAPLMVRDPHRDPRTEFVEIALTPERSFKISGRFFVRSDEK